MHALFLFFKGMTGALAPFIDLVLIFFCKIDPLRIKPLGIRLSLFLS